MALQLAKAIFLLGLGITKKINLFQWLKKHSLTKFSVLEMFLFTLAFEEWDIEEHSVTETG